MGELTRITLVTPSYNHAEFVESTIESVLDQQYENLEYMVLDGGSTDGTLGIIRKYEKYLSFWRSGPDGGQAAAIREGFARATGEVLNWLNSDDLLAPGALAIVDEMARKAPRADILAATTESFVDGAPSAARIKCVSSGIDLKTLLFRHGSGAVRHQPGIFFRRAKYEEAGGVDPAYRFCMDFDLLARMLEAGAQVRYDPRTLAYFRIHAGSKTASSLNVAETVREYCEIADAVGARAGIPPNHWPHLRSLVGGALHAGRSGKWREVARCGGMALRIASGLTLRRARGTDGSV